MNGIRLLVLFLQVLQVISSVEELRSLDNCGWTPRIPTEQIVNGNIIQPEEYSWLASLEYGSGNSFGYCGGSVISSRYVLTAAHCVNGEAVRVHGGLTGVRLGNFTQRPFCDYGTSNCSSFIRFGIADKIVHESYGRDSNLTIRNDIALLRVDRPIIFSLHMRRVCLPFNSSEPIVNTQLIVTGWGKTSVSTDAPAKRAVGVPLLDESKCEYQDESLICAAKLAQNVYESRSTCDGDSGGPLMHAVNPRLLVIEGIVSFIQGPCANQFSPTHYTRVRYYLSWIEKNVGTGSEYPTSTPPAWQKFPTDCGYPPMYPRERTDVEHFTRLDEYSWVAKLVYEIALLCDGSVINSRYVLTTADCVSEDWVTIIGALTGVRLGDYDENGHTCDYGTANCTQVFGIEKIIPHNGYRGNRRVNNIALIRLDRSILFGAKMKPICLPFGSNSIPEPPVDNSLTVTGWFNKKLAKRDATVILWKSEKCKAFRPVDDTHLCTENRCIGNPGSPLMYYELAHRRMFLEGTLSYRSPDCTSKRNPIVFTRLRSYLDWLDQSMEM